MEVDQGGRIKIKTEFYVTETKKGDRFKKAIVLNAKSPCKCL